MKLRIVMMVVALALAAPVAASNMAVALRVALDAQPRAFHLLSLPYLFEQTTAEGLCQELGGSGVVDAVLRWDDAASSWVTHGCGSGSSGFTLQEGTAYGVRLRPYQRIDTLLVGRHDATFSFGIAPGSGSNLSWVSLPYHVALPDAGGVAGAVDAEDLCRSVGPELFAVVRWGEGSGRYESHICGSEFGTPFVLEQGVGYGLVNADGATIQWKPPHY